MPLGSLVVKIGGDTSGLKSALDDAANLASSFAAKFGEGLVGAIGTGIGGLLVQQLVSSGALQGLTSSISSAIGGALSNVSFSDIGAKITGAVGGALDGLNIAGLKSKVATAFSGIGDAAAAEFATVSSTASESFAGITAAAEESATAISGAIASIGASEAAVASSSAGASTLFTGISAAASSAAASVGTFATTTLPEFVTGTLGPIASAAGLAAGLAAVGVAAVALTLDYSNLIQQQALVAAQLGDSFQSVNTLQGAAGLLGLKSGDLTSIFGGANFDQVLQNLGTSIDSSFSASRLQEISAIVDQFQALPDPIQRAQLAVQLFGAQAPQALALMNDSTKEAVAQAYDLSQAWDTSTRESLQRISDLWTGIKQFFSQEIDFSSTWAGFKNLAVEAVTSVETTIRGMVQGIVSGPGGLNDIGTAISNAVNSAISTLTGYSANWVGIGETIGAMIRQGLASAVSGIPFLSGGNPQQNLANDAFMQQQLRSILGANVPNSSNIAASIADPAAFAAATASVDQMTAQMASDYGALSSALSSAQSRLQGLQQQFETSPTSATLAQAVAQAQALVNQLSGVKNLIDDENAGFQNLADSIRALGVDTFASQLQTLQTEWDNVVNSNELSDTQLSEAYSNLQVKLTQLALQAHTTVDALEAGDAYTNTIGEQVQLQNQLNITTNAYKTLQDTITAWSLHANVPLDTGATQSLVPVNSNSSLLSLMTQFEDLKSEMDTFSQSQKAVADAAQNLNPLLDANVRSFTALDQAIVSTVGSTADVSNTFDTFASLAGQFKVDWDNIGATVADVQNELNYWGVNTQNQLHQVATSAEDSFDIINEAFASGKASLLDLNNGYDQMIDASLKAQGQSVTFEQLQNQQFQQIKSITDSIGSSISNAIINWKGFGALATSVLDTIGQSIIKNIVDNLLTSSGLIKDMMSGIGGLLKDVGLGNLSATSIANQQGTVSLTSDGQVLLNGKPLQLPSGYTAQPVSSYAAGTDTAVPANTTAVSANTTAINALTAALTPAVSANTAALTPNTAALAADTGATVALTASFSTTAALMASGDVVKATMEGVTSTFTPLMDSLDAATAANTIATTGETAATVSDTAATVSDTASSVALTTADAADAAAEAANTAALAANTVADTTKLAGLAGTAATDLAGYAQMPTEVGGAAGEDIASSVAGDLLGPYSGIVQAGASLIGGAMNSILGAFGLNREDNLLYAIEDLNLGMKNQLVDLQNSADRYWPELDHLVDIWGAILDQTTAVNQLDSDMISLLNNLATGLSGPGTGTGPKTSGLSKNPNAVSDITQGIDDVGTSAQSTTPTLSGLTAELHGLNDMAKRITSTLAANPNPLGFANQISGNSPIPVADQTAIAQQLAQMDTNLPTGMTPNGPVGTMTIPGSQDWANLPAVWYEPDPNTGQAVAVTGTMGQYAALSKGGSMGAQTPLGVSFSPGNTNPATVPGGIFNGVAGLEQTPGAFSYSSMYLPMTPDQFAADQRSAAFGYTGFTGYAPGAFMGGLNNWQAPSISGYQNTPYSAAINSLMHPISVTVNASAPGGRSTALAIIKGLRDVGVKI